MKTNITGKQNPANSQTKSVKRTGNKDTPVSREGEEQSERGDNVTHNKR